MIKEIQLYKLLIKAEFIFPSEIKKFIEKNDININEIINFSDWNVHLAEDFETIEKDNKIETNELNLKIVINYLHITQDNQIHVKTENFGKELTITSLDKGFIFNNISVGYKLFMF